MTLDFQASVWTTVWARLELAFEACARRAQELNPRVTMRWWHTGNDVFPFHATAWVPQTGDEHEELVLSVAFPVREGDLHAQVDLMEEHGPILQQLPSHNFGSMPKPEDILGYLPHVERFILDQSPRIAAAMEP